MAYRDTGHGDHEHHDVKYVYVFVALCIFTALAVLTDSLKGIPYPVKVVLVMSISTAKALSVMLFFMHLKFEGKWKYILLGPTIVLSIGLPFALWPDIGVRYYISAVPQDDDYDQAMAHHASHAEHDETEHAEGGHVDESGDHHPKGEHDHEEGASKDSKTESEE